MLFMKQEFNPVTYVAASVKSTVDCIIVQQGDKAKVRKSVSFQMKNVCQSINC